jgi:HK97 family phage major capsid protein
MKMPEQKIQELNQIVSELRQGYEEFKSKKHITEAEWKEKETKLNARIDQLETIVKRPQLFDGQDLKQEVPGAKEYKAAWFNFLRTGEMKLDEAAANYLKGLQKKALVSDAAGQILIPEELEAEIYRSLPKINVIRQYATVRAIGRDRIRRRSLTEVQMGWGKLELGGEPIETTVVPSEDHQYVEDLEGLAKIGKDELADTDVAIEPGIVDSFSRARAETEETAFINGTGHTNQQPEGILNGSVVTRVTSAAPDVIACDDMLDLAYAVPSQYRKNGIYLVPSTTELALRKLKDDDDQYLWQPSVQAGKPASFAGYPLENQEDIPALGASTGGDIAIFGDLKAGYRILDRSGMTIQRLVEIYATAGLVGLLASFRVGGGVIRPDALRILKEHT